jgi:histone-lysine N-methyltransferase SETD1
MSRTGPRSNLHALTPLTSSDSSPPGKLPSPRSATPAYDTMLAASKPTPTDTITITPVNTPPDSRPSVWPADGVLGQRLTYDPLLDPKLDKKARNTRSPSYKPILDKVR